MKKNILFTLLLLVSAHGINAMVPAPLYEPYCVAHANLKLNERATQSKWGTYKAIAIGSLLGGLMGTLNYATDVVFPLNWLALSSVRNNLAEDIAIDSPAALSTDDAYMLSNSAWLSDWIAYVYLWRMKYNERRSILN